MLDKLIESKNKGSENRRLGGFLFSTFTAAATVLVCALIYSLFTYNVAFGNDNLDISTIIKPVETAEQKPPAEQPAAAPKQQSAENTISKLPSRRENIMRVDENPTKIPTTVSVVQNQQAARPDSRFMLDRSDADSLSAGAYTGEKSGRTGTGTGISDALESQSRETVKTAVVAPPPVIKIEPKKVEPEIKKTLKTGGIVNGKAITLVKPEYSKAAQMVRAAGEVKIQVTIDEDGNVVSASAVSGHPLLRAPAVSAARSSKFTPTYLSNQRVKVTGIIVYNFKQL